MTALSSDSSCVMGSRFFLGQEKLDLQALWDHPADPAGVGQPAARCSWLVPLAVTSGVAVGRTPLSRNGRCGCGSRLSLYALPAVRPRSGSGGSGFTVLCFSYSCL